MGCSCCCSSARRRATRTSELPHPMLDGLKLESGVITKSRNPISLSWYSVHVGSMAFVDDYTAWVAGPSAEANRAGIQAIIDRALDWERRNGTQFEGEKTAVVQFYTEQEAILENAVPSQRGLGQTEGER